MISGSVVGVALDRAGERVAAERAEAHLLQLRHLAGLEGHALVVDHDHRPVAPDNRPLGRKVQRNDRNTFQIDVQPDVQLRPVGEREDAHRLAAAVPRVVEAPQLGPLVLRVPPVLRRAEREDALLRARALLVAARAAEGGVEAVLVQRLLEALGLHHVGVDDRAAVERVDAAREPVLVHVHEQVEVVLGDHALAEAVHVLELPRRVDVQERERRRRGIEGLAREVQHDRAVLADRVQHHRVLGLGDDLAHDVDRLRLEPLQVRELDAVDHAGTPRQPSSSSFAMTSCADSLGESAVVSRRSSGARRLLVRVADPGELRDLPRARLRVQALHVAPLALLHRRRDVDLDEHAVGGLDERARLPARLRVRRDGGDDDGRAVPRQPRGDPADALDVRVAVLLREAEPLREVRAHDVAVELLDEQASPLQLGRDEIRDRRLARPGEAGEPECEPDHFVWMPHSILSESAQRPARSSCSRLTGRVHGMQPMDG